MIKDIQGMQIKVGDRVAFATSSRTRPYQYILEILSIGEPLSSGYIAVKVKHLCPDFRFGPRIGELSTVDGSLFPRKALVLDES
jgi:hypothetical protein